MRLTDKKIAMALALALSSGGALFSLNAFAHTGATGVVKERMELMGNIGKAQKALSEMFSGKVVYDAKKVKQAAAAIEKHSGEALVKLFPKGSIKKPSEALPSIWKNWAEFKHMSDDLAIFAAALAGNADNKADAIASKKKDAMTGSTMGTNTMMGGKKLTVKEELEALKNLPPLASFERLAQTCSACHTKFRMKKK